MPDPRHVDVAAYALGGLDEHEDEAFRTHLDECPTCWAELERMVDVTSLLSRLDPADVLAEQERPGPHVLEGMLREVRAERRQGRYRTLVAVAAAVVLIVAGPIIAARTFGSDGNETAPPQAAPSPTAQTLPGKIFSATNASTGVTAKVGLEKKLWGTNIGLELTGVAGPQVCDLVAVSKAGESQVVTTWRVPVPGYGVPGAPKPLLTHGGAALSPDEIARLEVRTLSGQLLAQVPVSA